jgi:hypothetical protein
MTTEHGTKRPAVWKWYAFLCVSISALFFIAAILTGIAGFMGIDYFAALYRPFGIPFQNFYDFSNKVVTAMLVIVIFAIGIFFASVPFFPKRPWAWLVGFLFVLLPLAATPNFCLPIAIPLIIFWCKAENRQFYEIHSMHDILDAM